MARYDTNDTMTRCFVTLLKNKHFKNAPTSGRSDMFIKSCIQVTIFGVIGVIMSLTNKNKILLPLENLLNVKSFKMCFAVIFWCHLLS